MVTVEATAVPEEIAKIVRAAKETIAKKVLELLDAGETVFATGALDQIPGFTTHLQTNPQDAIFLTRATEHPNVPLFEPNLGFITEANDTVLVCVRQLPGPDFGTPDYSIRSGGYGIRQSLSEVLPDELSRAMLLYTEFQKPQHHLAVTLSEVEPG